VLFLRIGGPFTYVGVFLPTMLLVGIGFGLSFPAFNMQATAGIPNHEQGLASGLVNTSLQVGGALGLALTTAVITANTDGAMQGPALVDGFKPAIAVVTIISALGLVTALTGAGLRRAREPELALAPAGDGAVERAEERKAA
jgi:sugar phosphate permease